jgi:cold shock CspA family protein
MIVPLAEVAKWQTQLTQNQPGLTPHVGSTPTFGILSIETRQDVHVHASTVQQNMAMR